MFSLIAVSAGGVSAAGAVSAGAVSAGGQMLPIASTGDGGSIGLLFFLSGFLFYGFMYLKYRNTNKRHMHARETDATIDNVTGADEFVGKRKRQRNRRMQGANERQIEGAQNTGLAAQFMNGNSGAASGNMVRRIMKS